MSLSPHFTFCYVQDIQGGMWKWSCKSLNFLSQKDDKIRIFSNDHYYSVQHIFFYTSHLFIISAVHLLSNHNFLYAVQAFISFSPILIINYIILYSSKISYNFFWLFWKINYRLFSLATLLLHCTLLKIIIHGFINANRIHNNIILKLLLNCQKCVRQFQTTVSRS